MNKYSVEDGKFKELTVVIRQYQADLLIGKLETEGIAAFQSPGANVTQLHYPPIGVSSNIKIYVYEKDYAHALDILNATRNEEKNSESS